MELCDGEAYFNEAVSVLAAAFVANLKKAKVAEPAAYLPLVYASSPWNSGEEAGQESRCTSGRRNIVCTHGLSGIIKAGWHGASLHGGRSPGAKRI